MIRLTKTRLLFTHTTGKLQIIRGLPLLIRAEFFQLRLALQEIAAEQDARAAYDGDDRTFRDLLHHCLLLNQIEPSSIGIITASHLLLDTASGRAKLLDLNYPEYPPDPTDQKANKPIPEHIDQDGLDLSLLWSYAGSLGEALRIGNEVPWIEIYPAIRAWACQQRQADPKLKEKEQVKKSGETFKELVSSGKLDQMLAAMEGNGNSSIL